MIESRGWKGYMAIRGLATWYNSSGYVSVSTLKEWYDKGWDVFPHAWNLCSEDANEAAIREDCTKSMQFMAANGFHRGTFLGSACGQYGIKCTDDIGAREIAADYKVASRGVWGSPIAYARTNDGRPPTNVTTETPSWICADWYNMHDISLSVTLAAAKNYVDEAVLLDGIQSFHAHTISDSGELGITESRFAEFLDYVKAYEQQGKLEVITFTEWLNMTLMRPGCMKAGEGGKIFINSNEYKRLY